jgi:hypothetical protein
MTSVVAKKHTSFRFLTCQDFLSLDVYAGSNRTIPRDNVANFGEINRLRIDEVERETL